MTIRVLLADDDALLRAGVAVVLSTADGIDLAGEAADGLRADRKSSATKRARGECLPDQGAALAPFIDRIAPNGPDAVTAPDDKLSVRAHSAAMLLPKRLIPREPAIMICPVRV